MAHLVVRDGAMLVGMVGQLGTVTTTRSLVDDQKAAAYPGDTRAQRCFSSPHVLVRRRPVARPEAKHRRCRAHPIHPPSDRKPLRKSRIRVSDLRHAWQRVGRYVTSAGVLR